VKDLSFLEILEILEYLGKECIPFFNGEGEIIGFVNKKYDPSKKI
jgi:hypothetical protein